MGRRRPRRRPQMDDNDCGDKSSSANYAARISRPASRRPPPPISVGFVLLGLYLSTDTYVLLGLCQPADILRPRSGLGVIVTPQANVLSLTGTNCRLRRHSELDRGRRGPRANKAQQKRLASSCARCSRMRTAVHGGFSTRSSASDSTEDENIGRKSPCSRLAGGPVAYRFRRIGRQQSRRRSARRGRRRRDRICRRPRDLMRPAERLPHHYYRFQNPIFRHLSPGASR